MHWETIPCICTYLQSVHVSRCMEAHSVCMYLSQHIGYVQCLCVCSMLACKVMHSWVSLQTVQHVLSLRNTLRGFAKLSSYSWDTDTRCALYGFVQDTFQAGQLNSEQHSSWSLQLTGRTARIKATAGCLFYGCSSDLEIPEKMQHSYL